VPLDRLIQIHVSRHGVDDKGNYYDAHALPNREELDEVRHLLVRYDARYVTVEYYKDGDEFVRPIFDSLKNEMFTL
jgi:hypothetical protein